MKTCCDDSQIAWDDDKNPCDCECHDNDGWIPIDVETANFLIKEGVIRD